MWRMKNQPAKQFFHCTVLYPPVENTTLVTCMKCEGPSSNKLKQCTLQVWLMSTNKCSNAPPSIHQSSRLVIHLRYHLLVTSLHQPLKTMFGYVLTLMTPERAAQFTTTILL